MVLVCSLSQRKLRSALAVQQVKDLVLSLLWLRSQLWHRFDPWPWNFHMPWAWQKKKGQSHGRGRGVQGERRFQAHEGRLGLGQKMTPGGILSGGAGDSLRAVNCFAVQQK